MSDGEGPFSADKSKNVDELARSNWLDLPKFFRLEILGRMPATLENAELKHNGVLGVAITVFPHLKLNLHDVVGTRERGR